MSEAIGILDLIIGGFRSVFSIALLIAAAAATLAWGVRTRRVNAFGAPARFSRSVLEPLIAPVERRTVRFGGTPAQAPWWALLAFLLLGAIVLGVMGFVRSMVATTYVASTMGPLGLVRLAVVAVIAVLQLAIIARVVMSWIGGTYSRIGQLATLLTEWFLGPLRRVLPRFGMIDISPLVAYFGLVIIRGFVFNVL